jgi:uncharacterized membrane protein YbhN (UPF0104 family)
VQTSVTPEELTIPEELNDTPERDAHRLRNGVIWAVGLALMLLAIGLAVPDLRGVIDRASNAHVGWLVLALALELASCLGYVATMRLVLPRGPKREVRRLAWAEMAFGAVVPVGGAGGLAVGAWAMRAWGAPWSRVANRSAVVFLLTSAFNTTILGLAGLGVLLGIGTGSVGFVYGLAPTGVAVVALTFFLLLPLVRAPEAGHTRGARIRLTLHRVGEWVRDTVAVILQGDWRLLGVAAYLLCDIAVLWACLQAVGVAAPLLALVVGYQLGYLANLIPIPGGIGVLEGGLLAALLLYGLPAAPTAAAVILYHAIALWVPTVGGTVGFARLRRSIADRGATLEAVSGSGAVNGSGTVNGNGAVNGSGTLNGSERGLVTGEGAVAKGGPPAADRRRSDIAA